MAATGKSKVKKSGHKEFVRGGSGHMTRGQGAGPQKSGVSSQEGNGGGKWGKGGSGRMAGRTGASPAKPR